MTFLERSIKPNVINDLKTKMVFLAGPRQCGKTTLSKEILREVSGQYYSWDIDFDRRIIRDQRLDEASTLWVFDELHKFRKWRNWLKGVYDFHHERHSILVTGSGKLAVYSHGGDSLQGRYYLHRLHPFTLSELLGYGEHDSVEMIIPGRRAKKADAEALTDLFELGGFPEPLLSSSKREAARWRLSYGSRLVREDVRSLEFIRDIDRLELLYDRLPDVVGSPLSINSLRENLEVAFETVRHWLSVFENLYVCFRVPPFGAPRLKAVKKEQKLYLWDWSGIENEGYRFENLVAFHLLRYCHWCEDVAGEKIELRYFRDTVGHEVDFVLLRRKKPWIAIEVKLKDSKQDRNLKYLLERIAFKHAFQLTFSSQEDYRAPDINGCSLRIMPAASFLTGLP